MATGAAAAIARARRDIQHYFFSHDAVRPERAVPFEADRGVDRRQFERMRSNDIIREAGPGKYWLDVVAYDVDLCNRYRRVKTLLIILIIIFLIFAAGVPLIGGGLLIGRH
jgi:hypothetical protein